VVFINVVYLNFSLYRFNELACQRLSLCIILVFKQLQIINSESNLLILIYMLNFD